MQECKKNIEIKACKIGLKRPFLETPLIQAVEVKICFDFFTKCSSFYKIFSTWKISNFNSLRAEIIEGGGRAIIAQFPRVLNVSVVVSNFVCYCHCFLLLFCFSIEGKILDKFILFFGYFILFLYYIGYCDISHFSLLVIYDYT